VAVIRSISAAPRPTIDIDDSVTVTLLAVSAPLSLKDLESFIAAIRVRGGDDYQSVTWTWESLGSMGSQYALRLSAKIGWNVVLPEEEK
jgi:hypothetical protein